MNSSNYCSCITNGSKYYNNDYDNESKITTSVPKTMTLKEFITAWLNNNIGDGFRFKYSGQEFVVDDKKKSIHTVDIIYRYDYDNDYEDLFEWINTDTVLDENATIEITNYVYRIQATDFNYSFRTIYNTKAVSCCPVCSGRGFVSGGFYSSTGNTWVSSTTAPDTCRTCNGKGYIEV